MKKRNLLIPLAAVAAVVPTVTMVACNNNNKGSEYVDPEEAKVAESIQMAQNDITQQIEAYRETASAYTIMQMYTINEYTNEAFAHKNLTSHKVEAIKQIGLSINDALAVDDNPNAETYASKQAELLTMIYGNLNYVSDAIANLAQGLFIGIAQGYGEDGFIEWLDEYLSSVVYDKIVNDSSNAKAQALGKIYGGYIKATSKNYSALKDALLPVVESCYKLMMEGHIIERNMAWADYATGLFEAINNVPAAFTELLTIYEKITAQAESLLNDFPRMYLLYGEMGKNLFKGFGLGSGTTSDIVTAVMDAVNSIAGKASTNKYKVLGSVIGMMGLEIGLGTDQTTTTVTRYQKLIEMIIKL